MRRTSFLLMLVLPLVGLALGGAGRRGKGPSPYDTVDALKRAVSRGDRAAEWATLSPGFKLRLNREAGRVVDVGDYDAFRRQQAHDPQIREMEQLLMTCRVLKVEFDGRGEADVTIKFNKSAFLGQSIEVRMIHHALWELWIHGEAQPYWGFVGNKTTEALPGRDGSYTVVTRDPRGKVTWQQTFPKEQVRLYHSTTRWYFHDFGKAESVFMGLAEGEGNRVPPPAPRRR